MKKHDWIWPILVFIALSSILHLLQRNIPDLDSFYYIRQAWLYRTGDLFDSSFPWIQPSVIRIFSASLWYGFAIILIPFTYFRDLFFGIKAAGIIFTATLLSVYYLILKRHQIKAALFWPLLMIFSAPNVLTQLLMTRPQSVSLAITPILFSFLISGGFWVPLFASLGISWIHLNFFWLPIAMIAILGLVRFIAEKKYVWKEALAVLIGVIAGLFLRPNPIGAAKLLYVQVFKQILEKQGGLPLLFGQENFPLSLGTLFRNFSPILLLILSAAIFFLWLAWKKSLPKETSSRVFLWSSIALSAVFFIITVTVARRAYTFWILFGVAFAAACYSYLIPQLYSYRQKSVRDAATVFIALVFIFLVPASGYKAVNAIKNQNYSPEMLRGAALWLRDNSQPGEIVFNLHWSDFSPLFYWNQKNYYIGGLDPIFQYEYNPSLYWKFHYLSADAVTKKTCGAIECSREMLEDTYEVLVKDFNAKYILLDKKENPAVYFFLRNDTRFEKKFETESEIIYLIK